MDSQLYQELQRRFDSLDRQLGSISKDLRDHIEKDEEYWRRLDDQKAQIALVKWLGGTGILSSAALWLWQKFGH
jgi:RNA binding exosome subunit